MIILNRTEIHFDKWDALKILLGKKVLLSTDIEVDLDVSVLGTEQTIYVAPLIPSKRPVLVEQATPKT